MVDISDAAYLPLILRGYNHRYMAVPQRIYLPATTEEARVGVARSVSDGLRIAARSGGHCFEDFVDNPQTKSIIDLSRLDEVRWDAAARAFSVGPGALLGTVYDALYRGWGVTIPSGICLSVGMGGHATGGGYGPLSRRLGVVADYLHGVEVVVADGGKTSVVTATKDGPNADLWWAHTGGGGGNFGVVTRFLLRAPDSDGRDPATALPKAPGSMLNSKMIVPLTTEESFVRLIGNYLAFHEQYSEPGNRFAGLYAPLSVRATGEGYAEMIILMDGDVPDAPARVGEFVAAVVDGVSPAPIVLPLTRASYPDTVAQVYYPRGGITPRIKAKSAYLRKAYTPEQLRIFYRHLTDVRYVGESELEFLPFGGAINAVAPDATAYPVRDSFMKMLIHAAWRLPIDDDRFMSWAREIYREVYADTGGVPVPNERNAGAYINYPDPDLADRQWNTSGVPWHAFYYRDNYPRLLAAKRTWDPHNLFRHRLSIGAPDW